MTTTLDEELLRRALREAVSDLDPSPGAIDRVLKAAVQREAPRPDVKDGGHADDAVARSPRSRRIRVPLASAAAILLVSAAVLSFTELGSTGGAPLETHALGGISSPASPLGQPAKTWGTATDRRLSAAPGRDNAYGTNFGASVVTSGAKTANLDTKVVATGTIAMTVATARFEKVLAELTVLARRDGGYVASSNVQAHSASTSSTATIVLRVPQHRFDPLVTVVQRLGTTTSVVTNSTDVTGQYVDYVARIAALEASRAQYLAILARASSISDILAVQAQINDLQSQIEQLKGQRNVLVNEAAYSTLSVSLNPGPASSSSGASGLGTAWHDSVGGFVKGFEWLVRATGPALFAMLCLLVLLVLGRLGWRAARRRML